uniref:Uncharacterized protein n=1 Tax=viral metagenome TaxID=1070528 RepID=A0A6C0JR49_9ZZZZ
MFRFSATDDPKEILRKEMQELKTRLLKREEEMLILQAENIKLADQVHFLESTNKTQDDRIKSLEDCNKVIEIRATELTEHVASLHEEIEDLKNIFNNNARSRNMIIRSYSKTGLVSKFMPE